MKFNYDLQPGLDLKKDNLIHEKDIISIILPITSKAEKDDLRLTINSVLNQNFPNYELILVEDDIKDEIKDILDDFEDKRIKEVKFQSDGKLSAYYNFGVSKSSRTSSYILFLEIGDQLERVYLETLYWSLQINSNYNFAYTNYIIYGDENKLVSQWFEANKINLQLPALIRKNLVEENKFNEELEISEAIIDFWKKISNGNLPVHHSSYLTWIKDSNYYEGVPEKKDLRVIRENPNLEEKAIQYPRFIYNYETIEDVNSNIEVPKSKAKNEKINILMIVPWMITGGADIFNYELIKRLDKEKFSFTLLSTEPSVNDFKQSFDSVADGVYDLPTFLDQKDWLSFINYLIEKNNINLIFNTSSLYGYSILPYLKAKYPSIPIVDYVHMEEWYNRNGGYARSSSLLESIIDKTWVCNATTEEIFKTHFNRKEDEVETVYIGVDTERFNPEKFDKEELLKKYGLENNDKYIITYLCRVSEQKRPFLLANIIEKTIEKRDDILFLIVGDGNRLPDLKAAVKKYKDNVKFLPNTREAQEIYAISDATINCSIKEGLALTAYESVSMGVPVISSDVGGQKELVTEEVGRIVPCLQNETEIMNFNYSPEEINSYVDAIDEVIENLDELKSNCRKQILNKFTLEQMAQKMTNEFENIHENPNKEKIKNGEGLSNSIDIFKQLLISSMMEDKPKTDYQCSQFIKDSYKVQLSTENYNSLKNRLWKIKGWEKFTKSGIWKLGKKILRRG